MEDLVASMAEEREEGLSGSLRLARLRVVEPKPA